MVRFLLLLLLLLSPIRNSYAQYSNYCYCTTSWRQGTIYGSVCTANADCWACAPGAYNTTWQQAFCPTYQAPVVTCTTTYTEKTESCPVHQSGIKKYRQETKTCTDGTATQGSWLLYSNTCVQDPPTCQITSQQQTLSCETGYTGSITQTRSSTCPDPYGSPVWQPWATTSNTCVKSITNPTNVTSPVSPVSPVNPTSVVSQASSTSVQTTQSSTATAQTQSSVQNNQTTTDGLSAPTAVSSAPSSTAQTDAKATSTTTSAPTTTVSPTTSTTSVTPAPPAPKGKTQTAVGLALSLETIVKPALKQPNMYQQEEIVQGLPNEFLMQDQIMGLMFQPTIKQYLEPQDLGFEQ